MTADNGRALIEQFLQSMDQPGNDGFNTFCVSRFARQCGIKVVLSGLGGDELFGGYPSFQKVPQLFRWHRRSRGWRWLGRTAITVLKRTSMKFGELVADRLRAFLATSGSLTAAYWTMRSFFTPAEAAEISEFLTGKPFSLDFRAPVEEKIPDVPTVYDGVGYLETTRYMRNQLLRDSDVYSMAHGQELRVPLVDRDLFDCVNTIAAAVRYRPGKQLLLDAVPEIPEWIAGAPKRGFRFPFEKWVSGDWEEQFNQLETETPVDLGAWYRKWSLFTLKHFLSENDIAA